jgi:hypothetical protein
MLLDVLLDEHIPPTKGFVLHIAHLGDASLLEGFRVRAGSVQPAFVRGLVLRVRSCVTCRQRR